MQKFIIYKIVNNINGKIYIGSTRAGLIKRWCNHKWDARNRINNGLLYKAMNKYGIDNFKIEEIFNVLESRYLELYEKEFILRYNSFDRISGYNIHDPVTGNSDVLSESTKKSWADPIKREARITAIKKATKHRAKKIVAVHIESGNIIRFESIHRAMSEGFAASSICNSLKRHCLTGQKYVWFYDDEHTDEYFVRTTKELLGGFNDLFTRQLKSVDLKTKEEKIYDNVHKIKDDGFSVKVIMRALRKGYKHSCGKTWGFV